MRFLLSLQTGMQTTNISWATYSVVFVSGCTQVGPGCDNCYAKTFTHRQANREDGTLDYATAKPWDGNHEEEVVVVHDGTPTLVDAETGETVSTEDRRNQPYEYTFPKGPGRIFVVSMGDLFHRLVPESFIRDVVNIARSFPEHIWIFLTKRPRRAASVDVNWPANAWVGTSVESAEMTHRIDQLREVDAETRWISFEPVIDQIGPVDLTGFDWMVVGGESAPEEVRRPMKLEWVRELYQQSRDQDVNFFFKQSSHHLPGRGRRVVLEPGGDKKKIEEFPGLPNSTREARDNL